MTSRYTKKLYKLFFNITTTKKLKNKQYPILTIGEFLVDFGG